MRQELSRGLITCELHAQSFTRFQGLFRNKKDNYCHPQGTWLMRMLRTFYFSIFSHFSLSAALLKLTEVAFDIATVRFWEQNLVKIFSYSFAFSCYSLCFPLLESLYPVRPLNVVLHVADMITVWKFTYEITPQTMHFLAIDSRKHCSVAFQK